MGGYDAVPTRTPETLMPAYRPSPLAVRATDDSGDPAFGVGPSRTVSGVRVDNTPPTGTVAINAGAPYATSTSVTLALTADDGAYGSGVTKVRMSNNGTSWSPIVG